MIIITPLHLHGIWILFTLIYLIAICVLVTVTLGIWTFKWELSQLDEWSHHKITVGAVFGITLTAIYWFWIIAGAAPVIPEDPGVLVLHIGGSSAGITGGYVLWKLRRIQRAR